MLRVGFRPPFRVEGPLVTVIMGILQGMHTLLAELEIKAKPAEIQYCFDDIGASKGINQSTTTQIPSQNNCLQRLEGNDKQGQC